VESLKYYRKHEPKAIRHFEKELDLARRFLEPRYDAETLTAIHDEAVAGIKAITPRIPPIDLRYREGVAMLLYYPRFIALYKALSARGMSVSDYVLMQTHVMYDRLNRFPDVVQELTGSLASSDFLIRYEEKYAAASRDPARRAEYPKDFVFRQVDDSHVPGVKYKYEITQCPVQLMLDEQGVPELKPYCDFREVLMAKMGGYGWITHHGGEGEEFVCAVMMQHDGDAEVPQHLKYAFEGLAF